MAGVESLIVEEKSNEKPIDRQKTCPLLLRVFTSSNGHHNKISDYYRGNVPVNELQIYTWADATLHELSSLVKEVNPETRRKGTKFTFALVYPDYRSSSYRMREIGTTVSGQKGPDDSKMLHQLRFNIGDYLDIAITPADMWNGPNRKNYPNHNRQRDRMY